jgi:hypothetical protein
MTPHIRQRRWTPLSVFAVILGFIVWWPLGMLAIGYILWGGSIDGLVDDLATEAKKWFNHAPKKQSSTGNAAFDAYKEQTLKQLEEEEASFAAYIQKLREARDRDEFERFLSERSGQGN